MDIRQRMAEAMESGEVVGIIYHGGSQPGAYRDLTPLSFEGDKVWARCHQSRGRKSFRLDKIELRGTVPTAQDAANAWTEGAGRQETFNDVAGVHSAYAQELESLGWLVSLQLTDDAQYLELRDTYKNGNPKKNPVMELAYETVNWIPTIEGTGEVVLVNGGPRERCWGIREKGGRSVGTFKHCHTALDKFLTAARSGAPSRR